MTSPSSPGPHSAPDWRFVLALLAFVLLTLAAADIREAHRWRTAPRVTITAYYTRGRP